jgi:hypothetical protein
MVVTVGKDGRAFVERKVIRHVPTTRIVEVKSGDKVEKRQETVFVPVQEVTPVFLDDKGVTVYDSKGKRIDAKDLPKVVTRTMPVLVSADGKEIDKFFLSIVREGTLIVVAPALTVAQRPMISETPRPKR